MTNWARVGIPVGLGLLAGVMNWITVQSRLKPVEFVAVQRDIPRGETITADDLVPVEVAGDTKRMLAAAVRWQDRSVLFQALAARTLSRGDLVLLRDSLNKAEPKLGEGERLEQVNLPPGVTTKGVFAGEFVAFQLVSASVGPDADERSIADRYPQLGPYRVLTVNGDAYPAEPGEGVRDRDGKQVLTLAVRKSPHGQVAPDIRRLRAAASASGDEAIQSVYVVDDPARLFGSSAIAHR